MPFPPDPMRPVTFICEMGTVRFTPRARIKTSSCSGSLTFTTSKRNARVDIRCNAVSGTCRMRPEAGAVVAVVAAVRP